MTRLLAALRNETRVQYRNGFYAVSLMLMPIWFAVLVAIRDAGAEPFEPLLVFVAVTNLITTTFYFMAGLVLRERDEGVLDGLVVSPLRTTEYLGAKLMSLSVLAALETGIVIILAHDGPIEVAGLFAGITLLGALYAGFGFVAVAGHRALNTFLPPSIFWTSLMMLPLLGTFGIWSNPILDWHPVAPGIALVAGSLDPDTDFWWGHAAAAVLWLGIAFAWACRSFTRFVRRAAG